MVGIFRSRLRQPVDPRYEPMAERMLARARAMPGFLEFKSFAAPDGERVSLFAFASREALDAWYRDPEHREAQRLGREAFYSEYRLQVLETLHEVRFDGAERREADGPLAPPRGAQ